MKIALLGTALLTLAAAIPATQAAPPVLAGRWTQASNGSELVLVPKFKLQPNVGISYGTSLGGSVGYGSMTRTIIATDPMPLQVKRSMVLTIQPGGHFTWVTVKSHVETPNGKCIKTTRTERHGQAKQNGARLSFAIAGGVERWEKSCGDGGTANIGASSETYEMKLTGAQMQLVSGASSWLFRRG